jgi:iron complex outermembrane receptor protein
MARFGSRRAVNMLCCASAVALAAVAHAPALAQSTAEPTQLAEADTDELIVTATRRAERAIDVPISVSALSGEKLSVLNSSGQDIRFLSGRVPSLNIESSFGRTYPRFYLRGLGNADFSADAAQPVSIVLDNVALESPFFKAFPVFDLENIEVLKGPQGTLFGRNTPAGVVKMTSARPTKDFDTHVTGSWGTYNTVNSEVAIGGPITDELRVRLSGQMQRRDDWVKNDNPATRYEDEFEGYKDFAGRFQIEYEDGPFDALFNVHGRSLRGSARVFRANIIKSGTNDFTDGFDKDHVSQDGHNPQRLDTWGLNGQLSYDFEGAGTLFSVTGYEKGKLFSRGDIDGGSVYDFAFGSPTSSTPGVARFPVETGGYNRPEEFTQEIRFASEKFGAFRFQAGAYYFNQNLDGGGPGSGSWNTDGSFVQGSTSHLDNETYALFGSVDYEPTDALTLRGGLRWSHDKKRSKLVNGADIDVDAGALVAKASGDKWSWDGSATYKLTPNHSVYARVASGYLGTSIKNDLGTPPDVPALTTIAKPQTTISYEIGFKGQEPGLFTYSLAGYYADTKDIQLTAVGGASNRTILLNGDKAVGYGVEAEITSTPFENFDVTAGGSWNFTKIKDDSLAVAVPGTYPATILDPVVGGFALIDGNALPQAPRWIANFTARYGFPLGNDNEVFVFTDWAYRSKVNFFLYEAVEFTGKSTVEGGLRAGYRDNGRDFEIAAFARNITNQIRVVGAIDFNNLNGFINEPRIIGAEFKIGF